MKLAIFKRVDPALSYETVKGESYEEDSGFVRISEYVEVEFPPLSSGEVVQKQLEILDKAEGELRSKFQQALAGIQQSRQELLALTYQPAA